MNYIVYILSVFYCLLYACILFSNGAGIMPYFVHDNSIYFYISKDNHIVNTWNDFGGSFNLQESTLYNTGKTSQAFMQAAARNFFQETSGIFTNIYGISLNYLNTLKLLKSGYTQGVFFAERRFLKYVYRLFFVPVLDNSFFVLSNFSSYINSINNNILLDNKPKKVAIATVLIDDLLYTIDSTDSFVKVTGISYNIGQSNKDYVVALKNSFIEVLREAYILG